MAAGDKLPDLLVPGLRVVICGSAAGQKSALVGHYYAGPGNKFWQVLHAVGLTPRVLAPSEWQFLRDFGVGLTDIVKDQSGADRVIRFSGAEQLRARILEYAPAVLVFNGKKSAITYFDVKSISYGLQDDTIGATKVFVCPSTSAAAKKSWDQRWWQEMASIARAL